MLDIEFLLNHPEQFNEYINSRQLCIDTENVNSLYTNKKTAQQDLEKHQQERNYLSEIVGKKKANKESVDIEIVRVGLLKQEIENSKIIVKDLQEKLEKTLLELPNILDKSVPKGKDESDNQVITESGSIPTADFEYKNHLEIGKKLGMLPEHAAKVSGSRFCFFEADMALLHRALAQFMLYENRKAGYTEIYAPYIVNKACLEGTGQLPKFSEDLFKIDDNRYLIPTAEAPVTNLLRDTIVDNLPIKYTCHSPCFRSEAGSYGKDVTGIIRQHQFDKVELVEFCAPQDSMDRLESMTAHAALLLEKLGLAYRTILLCSADTGFSSSKTYDLEVWMPSQNKYREISSCSNCKDFQARRINARFKQNNDKAQFLHTLNGSSLAVGRALAAVLENYQREDGSVLIPEALHSYTDGLKELHPK